MKISFRSKHKSIFLVVIAVLVLIIIGSIAIFKPNNTVSDFAQGNIEELKVNDQSISISEVKESIDALPENMKEGRDEQELVDAYIDQTLLLQESKTQGIEVSEKEVDDYIQLAMTMSHMTEEDYNKSLAQYGITDEEYRAQLKDQLAIAKLINNSIKEEDYQVSEQEIDKFLEDNKEDFKDFFEENDEAYLEALRSRIELQLQLNKKTQALQEYVQELRDKTEIRQ